MGGRQAVRCGFERGDGMLTAVVDVPIAGVWREPIIAATKPC
jgi:hypothetical protein